MGVSFKVRVLSFEVVALKDWVGTMLSLREVSDD